MVSLKKGESERESETERQSASGYTFFIFSPRLGETEMEMKRHQKANDTQTRTASLV